jgi:hypothetical protein
MSRLLASLLLSCTAVSTTACLAEPGAGVESEAIAVAAAPLIQATPTSDPVTVDTYDWNGNKTTLVIYDGNVQTSASGATLTYKVGSSTADANPRTLSFYRSGNKLVVSATSYFVLNGLRTPFSRTAAETTPNLGTSMTSGSIFQPSACTAGPLGPFVRTSNSCYSPLLDQRVLARVPRARTLNGAPPVGLAQVLSLAINYNDLYANHLLLWDTFRYRAELNAAGVDRAQVYAALDEYLATTDAADHHHHIDHNIALGDQNEDWTDLGAHAGFLDGHRAYMNQFESWLLAHPPHKLPFQRTPAWIPTTVPAEFAADVSVTSGGLGIPSQYAAGTICATYKTSTTPVRLDAMKALGVGAYNGWHGGIHGQFGGTFGAFSTAASAPLFWPWHTAVDAGWANLQRCYLDDDASL